MRSHRRIEKMEEWVALCGAGGMLRWLVHCAVSSALLRYAAQQTIVVTHCYRGAATRRWAGQSDAVVRCHFVAVITRAVAGRACGRFDASDRSIPTP